MCRISSAALMPELRTDARRLTPSLSWGRPRWRLAYYPPGTRLGNEGVAPLWQGASACGCECPSAPPCLPRHFIFIRHSPFAVMQRRHFLLQSLAASAAPFSRAAEARKRSASARSAPPTLTPAAKWSHAQPHRSLRGRRQSPSPTRRDGRARKVEDVRLASPWMTEDELLAAPDLAAVAVETRSRGLRRHRAQMHPRRQTHPSRQARRARSRRVQSPAPRGRAARAHRADGLHAALQSRVRASLPRRARGLARRDHRDRRRDGQARGRRHARRHRRDCPAAECSNSAVTSSTPSSRCSANLQPSTPCPRRRATTA